MVVSARVWPLLPPSSRVGHLPCGHHTPTAIGNRGLVNAESGNGCCRWIATLAHTSQHAACSIQRRAATIDRHRCTECGQMLQAEAGGGASLVSVSTGQTPYVAQQPLSRPPLSPSSVEALAKCGLLVEASSHLLTPLLLCGRLRRCGARTGCTQQEDCW